jgi:hypothetical protein
MTVDDVKRAVAELAATGLQPPEMAVVTPSIDRLCADLGVSKLAVPDPDTARVCGLRVVVSKFVDRTRVLPAAVFAPTRYDVPLWSEFRPANETAPG